MTKQLFELIQLVSLQKVVLMPIVDLQEERLYVTPMVALVVMVEEHFLEKMSQRLIDVPLTMQDM
jgi:hypothetical protein